MNIDAGLTVQRWTLTTYHASFLTSYNDTIAKDCSEMCIEEEGCFGWSLYYLAEAQPDKHGKCLAAGDGLLTDVLQVGVVGGFRTSCSGEIKYPFSCIINGEDG